MTTPVQQSVPFSQEAEEALLGAVLLNSDSFLNVASFLNPDDFFLKRHEYVWIAFGRLQERNDPMDYITVSQELRDMTVLDEIGGQAFLTYLVNNTPSSVHAEVYGRLVERASIRRKMLIATDEIRKLAFDEEMPIDRVISDAEQALFTVSDSQVKREFVPMWQAVSEYYDEMEKLLAAGTGLVGVPTGFKALDGLLGGFQKSDLIVFAGRPGMGKCITGDTLIATSNGLMPIEQLKPNTQGIPDDEGGIFYPLEIGVQTPDGIKKTSHFYDSGIKPTLKLTTRAGYSLAGTHHHPVRVKRLNESALSWQSLSNIKVGDAVLVQSNHSQNDYQLQAVTSIVDNGLQHCYDLTVPDGHTFVANGIVSHNTSFLLTVALNIARFGARVALFTMEMGVEQMVQRLISMETGIRMQQLRTADLSAREHSRFTEAVGRIANLPIFIDDTPAINPIEMRTKCRRLQHEYGLDLVMVDYMQLMSAGKAYENNRVQEISYISRSLKELARELNVTVLSAAQLSRAVEQRQDKRPQLSDLRESGCLAGETQVYLPDEGYSVAIESLVGKKNFRVLSLNTDTWKLEFGTVTNAFCTGTKPVYRMTTALGRTIRATANHKFLTIDGWKRLDELRHIDTIALPATHNSILEHEAIVENHKNLFGNSLNAKYGADIPLDVPTRSCDIGRREAQRRVREHEVCNIQTRSELAHQSEISDVYWDKIVSIEPDGETTVYDLTVDTYHNFCADLIIVHNSIEQDADAVMFLYRDEVYNPETTEFPNQADVLLSKHRHGPTGTISLYFEKSITKFMDVDMQRVDLSNLE